MLKLISLIWVFSDLTCHLEDTGIGTFLVALCRLIDSKETKLRSSDQEASPSGDKNIRVVLMQCSISVFRLIML